MGMRAWMWAVALTVALATSEAWPAHAQTTGPPSVSVPGTAAPASVTHASDVVAYTTDRTPSGQAGPPLVQVTLEDGTPAIFLLDTGTSECAVTDVMAARLGLTPHAIDKPAAPLIMDGPTAQAVPLTIQLGHFRFARFQTLIVKARRFQDVLGRPLDGILGMNLLLHFAMVIEPGNHLLVLLTPGGLSAADVQSWGFTHCGVLTMTHTANGTYWAPVGLVNGLRSAQESLMIDTGASTSILSHTQAVALDLPPTQTGVSIPYGDGIFSADLAHVPFVTLGPLLGNAKSTLTLKNGAFLYPDQPDDSGSSPHVLGLNILSACSVLMDFPGNALYLQPLQLEK